MAGMPLPSTSPWCLAFYRPLEFEPGHEVTTRYRHSPRLPDGSTATLIDEVAIFVFILLPVSCY